MATIERFEDIQAWQKTRELIRAIYVTTGSGAFAKDYALVSQIRRAAVSVLSNIAEGFERDGKGEFVQFLSVAKGSVGELRAQLYVALDAGFLTNDEFNALSNNAIEISRMLSGLMRYLKTTDIRGQKFK